MDEKYARYLLNKTCNDYNLIADDFSRTRRNIWPEIKFLFDDYLTAGEKVLDLGCGNGRFYEFFKDKDINYIGADNSKKLIELAKQKYPEADFRTDNALNPSFPNSYFDKVYSIAVLHHIPSKELRVQFLKEAKRVLKKEGKLIITVWKFHNKKERLLLLRYTILKIIGKSKLDFKDILEPWSNKTLRYYHWFSKRELRDLASQAGFKIKKIGIARNKKGNRQNIYVVAEK